MKTCINRIVQLALLVSMIGAATSFSMSTRSSKRWTWKGHEISTQFLPQTSTGFFEKAKPAVLLIHGFGCSTTYWRATASALSEKGYEVHALDLLGQGLSAKPERKDGVEYSINLWAEMVDDYAKENMVGKDVVLVGNSIGSLIALSATSGDFLSDNKSSGFLTEKTKGICMFNCGVGLNARGIANESQWSPTQRFLINKLFDVLDTLIFNNQALLGYVLEEVVTEELLRETLQGLYKYSPERVDDELVESFFAPAKTKGAVDALSQIYTNNPGKTPMDLHNEYDNILSKIPIKLVWGDDDAIASVKGGVGQFYTKLSENEDVNVSLDIISAGHVPFDDNPIQSNDLFLEWLENLDKNSDVKESGSALDGLGRLFSR
jgi:pimeloyl-ACP methyl ester carboxylesterase